MSHSLFFAISLAKGKKLKHTCELAAAAAVCACSYLGTKKDSVDKALDKAVVSTMPQTDQV